MMSNWFLIEEEVTGTTSDMSWMVNEKRHFLNQMKVAMTI